MHKVLDACLNAIAENKNEKVARTAACKQFIEELKNMKGEDLEPHLSEMVLKKETRMLKITFDFSMPFEPQAS